MMMLHRIWLFIGLDCRGSPIQVREDVADLWPSIPVGRDSHCAANCVQLSPSQSDVQSDRLAAEHQHAQFKKLTHNDLQTTELSLHRCVALQQTYSRGICSQQTYACNFSARYTHVFAAWTRRAYTKHVVYISPPQSKLFDRATRCIPS